MTKSSRGKKIVIVTSRPLCEPALQNRIMPFMKLLLRYGYEVCLVCPEHIENAALQPPAVQLQEVPIALSRPRNFIKRAFSESKDSLVLLKRAKSIKADVWLITIPSMFLAFIAPFVLLRRKAVLDVRDLAWEYLSEKKLLQRLSKRIFRMAFKRSLTFFRAITVTNPAELEYVAKAARGNSLPLLVSNGIEQDRFDSLAGLKSPEGALTVTYIGNVGLAQRLDTLLAAAMRLPETRFTIAGSGVDFERILRLVTEHKLRNVHLTGMVSWRSVRELYDRTDILYAQLARDFSGAVPSKLYEYLASGKYVIYGGQGEAANALKRFEHHRLISPCDVDALVSAIKDYEKNHDRKKISRANRNRIQAEHIREDSAEHLVQRIISIARD